MLVVGFVPEISTPHACFLEHLVLLKLLL